jgi:HAD superfamily hydrolase (TIGR01509 family)
MDPLSKGVIWDLDGTLVNTSDLHFAAWSRIMEEHGRPFSYEEFARTFGRRNPEILKILFGDSLDPATVDALGDHKEELFRAAAQEKGVPLLPGATTIVQELDRQGWRQAIGSSAPRENITFLLGLTDLAPYMTAIVSMEDTNAGKPDPEVFLKAAGKLGTPPAWCVVVEDAVFGVQAAKAGGMGCIAVRGGGHSTWEDLKDAGADLVIESLEDVQVHSFERLVR